MIRSDGLLLNYKLCKDVKEVVGEMYRSSKNLFFIFFVLTTGYFR